jgi:hypothetical protein
LPRIGEAWVDVSTRDAGFYKGMGAARKEVEATSTSFSRSTSIMVRSAERPYRAMRRIFNMLKEVAQQTEFGKLAVEDYDNAWKGLIDSLIKMLPGGWDAATLFETLASAMKMLTKGTEDYYMALDAVTISLIQARKYWGKFLGDTFEDQAQFTAQIEELNKKMKASNEDLTKRDVANAQKRIDAAKKEHAEKGAEFFGIADLWKDAQKRMTEKEKGMMNRAPEEPAGPAAPEKGVLGMLGRWLTQGIVKTDMNDPHWADRHSSAFRNKGEAEGTKHEIIDELMHSDDPKDRKAGLEYQQEEDRYKEMRQGDVAPNTMTKEQGDEVVRTLKSIETEAKKKKPIVGR